MKTVLLILSFALLVLSGYAQIRGDCRDIQIGNGTAAVYEYPVDFSFKNSYVQELFDASEVGDFSGNMAITALSFEHTGAALTKSRITIYLGNTAKTSFDGVSATDWVPASELKQVWSGNIDFISPWVTITFDIPFKYTGGGLVVAILNEDGSYQSAANRFLSHSTAPVNKTLFYQTDNDMFDIYTPMEASGRTTNRNNFKFTVCPASYIIDVDMQAVGITGNSTPIATKPSDYTVTVRNNGDDIARNYTIKLMTEANEILTQKVVTDKLMPGATAKITIPCTFTKAIPIKIKGCVEIANDRIPANNNTLLYALDIMPSETKSVSIGNGTLLSGSMPFDFGWSTSVVQSLYLSSDIGFGAGLITQLVYKLNSTGLVGDTVRIYMANTEFDNLLDVKWIPLDQFTLVYEGSSNIPKGISDLLIKLQTPFVYTGKNMCIMTEKPMGDPNYIANVRGYITTVTPHRTRCYSNYFQEFNGTQDGFSYNTVPNIGLSINVASPGAMSGTVTSLGKPVEGVSVVLSPQGLVATTASDGAYSISYVPEGTYTLTSTKYGYFDKVETVEIEGGVDLVKNFTMQERPLHQISITVLDVDGEPIEGAVVAVEGYKNYSAVTSADGTCFISAYEADGYAITVSKSRLVAYADNFDLKDKKSLRIILEDVLYAPYNVLALDHTAGIKISWGNPVNAYPKTYSLDDESCEGGWAMTSSMTANFGNFFNTADAGAITSVDMYGVNNFENTNREVFVTIFNANGELIGQSNSFIIPSNKWINIPLPNIPFEGGFYAMVNWPATPGASNYVGYDTNGPNAGEALAWFNSGSTWMPFHEMANCNPGVFMIRVNAMSAENKTTSYGCAKNVPQRKSSQSKTDIFLTTHLASFAGNPPVATNGENTKSVLHFKVWRLKEVDQTNEAAWELLTPSAISSTEFIDNTWAPLDWGIYKYAVKTVYANDRLSSAAFSNTLPKEMQVPVTMNIITNTGISAEGAEVVFTSIDAMHVYRGTVDAEGVVVLPSVWRDTYNVRISLDGFYTFTATDVEVSDAKTLQYELKELLTPPNELLIVENGNPTQRIFSWNNAFIENGAESYQAFQVNPAGESGWTYHGNGGTTYGLSTCSFPGMGSDFDYIAFNPGKTTPPSTDENLLAHSGEQYLACFTTDVIRPNDHWVISPELDYSSAFTLSFWARSYSSAYELERFKVRYSTTTNDPAAFTGYLAGSSGPDTDPSSYERTPADWTKYSYTVPAEAKYIAIQCVSNNGFIFMLDDIYIGYTGRKNSPDKRSLQNYTVYLDGEEVAANLYNTDYIFTKLTNGQHVAGVQAIYSSGVSDIETIGFQVDAPLTVFTLAPGNGSSGVIPNAEVSVTFNKEIVANDLTAITINGKKVTATTSGNKLIINHSGFEEKTSYTVNIPVGTISDYEQAITWSFTTNYTLTLTWGAVAGEKKTSWVQVAEGGSYTVDWGDGSAPKTMNGTPDWQEISHSYLVAGNFSVKITKATENCLITGFDCWNAGVVSLDVSEITSLTNLGCATNRLTELNVSRLTALKELYCFENQLTELNVSGLTALRDFKCFNNQLSKLDVSGFTALKELECYNNQLTELNVSGCTALTSLKSGNNQLTTLNASGLPVLTTLWCNNNRLITLEVNGCKALKLLDCYKNQLLALDVSGLAALIQLRGYDNRLTTLNIKGCTSLKELDCYNNQLNQLDASGLTALEKLSCYDNQLMELNVDGTVKLIDLRCFNNQLGTLDVSGMANLSILHCQNNQLTTLDVSGLTVLMSLDCSSNRLTDLGMSRVMGLWEFSCYDNRLQLSDLYIASGQIDDKRVKKLGTQTLLKQNATVGKTVDFSTQKEFDEIETVFDLEKNGLPAVDGTDYTIAEGIITFREKGNYKITMTNGAIVSYADYPAKVIAEYNLEETDIMNFETLDIHVYPNPTKGLLRIANDELQINNVTLFDLFGRAVAEKSYLIVLQGKTADIDISHLLSGVYLVRIETGKGVFTEKVIKE